MRPLLTLFLVLSLSDVLTADAPPPDNPTAKAKDRQESEGLAINLLNRTRFALGLDPLELDPQLQEIAEDRLAANVNRGDWRHHKRRGRLVGRFFPARAEGVGVTDTNKRWVTCYSMTTKHRFAGCAITKVGDRYWQLLLVR